MIALVASSPEASLLSGGMTVNPRYFELFKSCDDMPWEFPWFWISNSHLKVLFDHMSLNQTKESTNSQSELRKYTKEPMKTQSKEANCR